MLIKLEVQNFRSFNTRKVFHTIQRNYKRFTEHIRKIDEDLSILKTTSIYGANGSGKTNLLKALYVIKKLIEDSNYMNTLEGQKLLAPFKLDEDCKTRETQFKVDFIHNEMIYVYEISILLSNKKVVKERLLKADPQGDMDEKVVFERGTDPNGNPIFNYWIQSESETWREVVAKIVPAHALVLSFNIFKDVDISNAIDWFTNYVRFLFPENEFADIAYILYHKPEYLELANKIIDSTSTGIHEIRIEEYPVEIYLGTENKGEISLIISRLDKRDYFAFIDSRGYPCTAVKNTSGQVKILKPVCIHKDKNGKLVPFDIDQESKGTLAVLHLIPALILSYGEGVNYFIDDINTSLHPILLREIMGQYVEKNLGAAKGQLIFNSHEDFLMDERIFRQDEIWLAEKNEKGESDIFPLSDFSNIRHDLSLRKNYLNGLFGGVPFRTQPEQLNFGNNG